MTWLIADHYGARNGNKFVCRIYQEGCSMFEGWGANNCVKASEDVADVLVAVTYPIRDEMREILNTPAMVNWCGKDAKTLRDECLEAWEEMDRAEGKK